MTQTQSLQNGVPHGMVSSAPSSMFVRYAEQYGASSSAR